MAANFRFLVFTVVAAVAGLTTTANSASAEDQKWVPGKRFVESSARVMSGVRELDKKTEYGYVSDICLLAAFLLKDRDITFIRRFESGEQYMVVGGGDDGVKDLDLMIIDVATGKSIAKDTSSDPTALVEFKVPRTGNYRIKVIMADAAENGGFATIGILRKGGFSVPVDNLATALGNLMESCEKVDRATKHPVLFSSGNNQWAVYGAIIKQGESSTITGLQPGGGPRIWVTGGDTAAKDLDLYLMDSDGDVIVKDEDDDPRPVLFYKTKSSASYGFRVKNVKSSGPSFVLTAVLAIDD